MLRLCRLTTALSPAEQRLYSGHTPLGWLGQITVTAVAGAMGLQDPTRGDYVGLVLEAFPGTSVALASLRRRIATTPTGARQLELRPRITEAVLARDPRWRAALAPGHPPEPATLGTAYAQFMTRHGFHVADRAAVCAYQPLPNTPQSIIGKDVWLLQRCREAHDLLHVLLGVDTTVPGEVLVKCFEACQTGLPGHWAHATAGCARVMLDRSCDRGAFLCDGLAWICESAYRVPLYLGLPFEDWLERDADKVRQACCVPPFPPTLAPHALRPA